MSGSPLAGGPAAGRTDRRKRRDGADQEGDEVGDRGDRDGDGRLGVGLGQPLGDRRLAGGAPPGGQQHERVVHADACGARRSGRSGGGGGGGGGEGGR